MPDPSPVLQRILPPEISANGTVRYRSITSMPDESTAVCYFVPDRVIPVIFVPGIMGSNLQQVGSGEPIWLLDSEGGAFADWAAKGAVERSKLLHPDRTTVFPNGKITSGTVQTETELRRRGWGEVARSSYGEWLVWLENTLNDSAYCKIGHRAKLMEKLSNDIGPLTFNEVALSYKYQFPVHAVGYNWLQSNSASAVRLRDKIYEFRAFYRERKMMCEKVIIITHSMGGLVARYYSEVLQQAGGVAGHRDKVLGVIHGVMPAVGAAAAYKRVRAGNEGYFASKVLGSSSDSVTAVFAQSPGALQLLPGPEYGIGWLKIRDVDRREALPISDPYAEIYTQRNKWWGLLDEKLINPVDKNKKTLDADWKRCVDLIKKEVLTFHKQIKLKYHDNTHVFYGDDKGDFLTWGDVTWRRREPMLGKTKPVDNLLGQDKNWSSGTGELMLSDPNRRSDPWFVLDPASERGDSTVPARSGRAPFGQKGVRTCISYQGISHEGAFKKIETQLFSLWAIVKVVQNVKGTELEYKK